MLKHESVAPMPKTVDIGLQRQYPYAYPVYFSREIPYIVAVLPLRQDQALTL